MLRPDLAGALLGAGAGGLGGYLGGRAAGRFGQGVVSGSAHAYPNKEAAAKEAFAGALMQGIKGMANFAGAAGKSIAGAAQGGGLHAAGHAAANAGRAGMYRAGQFMSQNPGAGAALVAAPALAAGYAAGRQ